MGIDKQPSPSKRWSLCISNILSRSKFRARWVTLFGEIVTSAQAQLKCIPRTLILVKPCKWGPFAAMLITAPVSVHSLCNYDWTTLLVTTWTNVFRDQRRLDSSSWVMTFHPPVCPANERGFMSSAACRRPMGSLLLSTDGKKKRKSKPFFRL